MPEDNKLTTEELEAMPVIDLGYDYDQPEEYPNLPQELTDILNKYNREALSDTPDFILSRYLMGCLVNFEETTKLRQIWYQNGESKALPNTDPSPKDAK